MSAPPGMSSNPFEVLGLDRSASFDDVKLAYRRLAREHHPDANRDDPNAIERFTALRQAYDRLKVFYQTVDKAAPAAKPSVAETPRPISMDTMPTRAHVVETAAPAQSAAAAPSRDTMPEPGVPGTGNRRAFRRTGPIRQSGEVRPSGDIRLSGDIRPSGDIRLSGDIRHSGDISTPAPRAARPSAARLPAPQVFGSGHLATRAEVVFDHPTMAPTTDAQMVYALVGLCTSENIVFPRVPLNLCLVLDHSSSMLRGGKVDRLKETVRGIIDQLDEDDYLAIVSFGDRAEVLLPAQPLHNRGMVHGAIDAMRCRGGTEISRGLAAGLTELARNASRALSHIILLTDGQTYGDEAICLQQAEEAASMNVGITAYGLGADWNSTLLDGIAGPTSGHSDYIESPEEMARAFNARVSALQSTTLRKVTLSITPADGCAVRRATLVSPLLRPLELADGQRAQMATIGDMSSNTDYRMLLEFVLGATRPGKVPVANLTFCYDVPGLQREAETLVIPLTTTVTPDHDPQLPVDPRVTEALRHMTVHRLQQQAWTEINGGNVAKGTGLLKRAAEHLEVAGHADLARVAAAEAQRVEGGDAVSDENVKRIIYGTRKLG